MARPTPPSAIGATRAIGTLAAKDLRRRIAAPLGALISLGIPLAIAGTMALAFGDRPGGTGDSAPKLRLVLVDLDDTPVSGIIAGAGGAPEARERLDVRRAASREEALAVMKDGEYPAILVIPDGFGEALLEGRRVELELLKNPSQRFMPVVAQQITEVLALYLSAASRLLGEDGPRLRQYLEGEGWDDSVALASLVVTLSGRARGVRDLLLPPIIEVGGAGGTGGAGRRSFDLMGWMYPGIMIMGLLFIGLHQMKDLLAEREAGTLRRLLSSPVGAGTVLVAKMISVAVMVAVSLAILLAMGSLFFGVRWGSPGVLLAAGALIVLAVTGFAALVFSLVRTERQGDAFGGILTMLMSLLGGAFVPPQIMPDWLASVSRMTLSYWGNEALRQLSTGQGAAPLALCLTVLGLFGAVTTLGGMLVLRRRHMAGAL